jgi:3-oxoacyl-[acyl-carrier-protein] synthase II
MLSANHSSKPQRVVVTGLGAISPLGSSVDLLWDGWLNGRSGIRRVTSFDVTGYPCQIAGEVPDFQVEKYLDRKEARRLARSAQFGLAAAIQAVRDAGLPDVMPDGERCGVVFGTAVGGLDKMDEGVTLLRAEGPSRLGPFFITAMIPNLASFLVSKQFQCFGYNTTVTTACAAGTQSVGEGAHLIRNGKLDLVICGGTEALVRDFALAGFASMRALPINYNDCPEKASRPFDLNREGFIFSEGAASLILESLDHALARGARIYAEVIGYASSMDAYHVAAPDPEVIGAIRAMRWALEDAGIEPSAVNYINAHGTSTPLNDAGETRAIKTVFGEHAYKLAVSSTKSMIGHAMGASGSLEALACAKVLSEGIIPPTINYETPDPECDLDYVPNQARQADIQVTLSNSFGLGGQNACLVMKKYSEIG